MSDNQSPLIRSASDRDSYYRAENSGRPNSEVSEHKKFKNILDKDERRRGSDGDKVKDGEGEEEALDTKLVDQHKPLQAPKDAPSSPFSLFDQPFSKPQKASNRASGKGAESKEGLLDATEKKALIASRQITNETGDLEPLIGEQDEEAGLNPQTAQVNDPAFSQREFNPSKLQEQSHQQPMKKNEESFIKEAVKETSQQLAGKEPSTAKEAVAASEIPAQLNQKVINDRQKAEKAVSQFNREQPDLSYINPLGTPMASLESAMTGVQSEKPVANTRNLQILVERLVKEMSVLTTSDKSETTVVLSHPPQFEGVRIVITNNQNAQNEFNLKFENLTQSAQMLVTQQQNRADLLSNLEQKGYNVHIFVTTTYDEGSSFTAEAQSGRPGDNRSNTEKDQEGGEFGEGET